MLDAVLEKMERPRRKAVVVSTKEGPRRLLLDQILYVERAGRRLRYYCIDGTVDSVSLRVPFHKGSGVSAGRLPVLSMRLQLCF